MKLRALRPGHLIITTASLIVLALTSSCKKQDDELQAELPKLSKCFPQENLIAQISYGEFEGHWRFRSNEAFHINKSAVENFIGPDWHEDSAVGFAKHSKNPITGEMSEITNLCVYFNRDHPIHMISIEEIMEDNDSNSRIITVAIVQYTIPKSQ